MPDYSKCVPDRVTEIREFLSSDRFDRAVRALRSGFEPLRQQASEEVEPITLTIDFSRVGLDVRVTRHQAQVVVHDPTPDVMDAVADSGRSFTAVY